MKKILITISILAFIITACSPEFQGTEAPADEADTVVPTVEPEQDLDPLEEAVIKQLATNLVLKERDISVVSNEIVEFSDSCLGITMQDVKCEQVTTPGRIIILEANNIQYEYHTSENGTLIQPATLALTWKREGGIAGFCDSMAVFLSGEIIGSQCKSQPNATTGTFASLLSASDRKQFDAWITQFDEMTLDASDPKGVSDRMEVTLVLYGLGSSGKPVQAEQQAIFSWAQKLFQKLYS